MSDTEEEIAPVKDAAQKRMCRLREHELERVLYLRVSAQARNLWPPCPRSATSAAGPLRARPGHARRAQRGGAPQGTRNFEQRSEVKVYGATPSSAAKETVTHPKEHRGGGFLRGRRSPSGELPRASSDAASKTGYHSRDVERSEA